MSTQNSNNELTLEQLEQVSGGEHIAMTFERVAPESISQSSTNSEWKYVSVRRF